MIGKCPKCGLTLPSVDVNEVKTGLFFGTKWRAVTYNCTHCSTVLGCQVDPVAIKTEIVNEVLRALRQ